MTLHLWEARFSERFTRCFPELEHFHQAVRGVMFRECWSSEDQVLSAGWKIRLKTDGSVSFIIEEFIASPIRKGWAVSFLKTVVEVLQENAKPRSCIKVSAFSTGLNSSLNYRGAYVWSQLGFDAAKGSIEKLKNSLQAYIQADNVKDHILACLPGQDACRLDEILHSVSIQSIKHPWEITNLTIIGYCFMAHCSVEYTGVLYPNQPNSPGMAQYARRISHLKINSQHD